tara:strand:+ start:1831 stop:2835 length:1005 start_codon:yes stop_codon:yes gene_type:complete
MATLAVTHPTLADVAKATDPDGKISTIVEILNETNEILEDMVWVEGNLPTGHRTTIRAGLPTPTWRKLYGGVQPTKSTNVQVTDTTGMLEAYAEIDKALADLNGNSSAFRMTEDKAHIEGMSQEFAATLMYGNEGSAPEEFTGFAPRFNDNSGPANSDNIILGGGSGSDNSSIWLISWGANTVHGIYPKGSKAGLQFNDKGQVTIEDSDGSNGGRYEAYRSHYRWDCGLSVRDWRYVVRICNVDNSALQADKGGSSADITDLMAQALELLPNASSGRPAFYMNRTLRSTLRRQIANTTNVNLTMDQVGGKHVMSFDGIPVRRCDMLTSTEATIS